MGKEKFGNKPAISTDAPRILITSDNQAEERLAEINTILDFKNLKNLVSDTAEIEIEKFWLSFRLKRITSEERQVSMGEMLDNLEETNPDVYEGLIRENGHGNRLAEIRDRVIPSRRKERL